MRSQPRWDDAGFKAGTMIRGALWLVQEVGEGNTFTKDQLRKAFPGVSQADRRIRDLRDYGWVIHTNTEDASLFAEDQRLVRVGVAVWNPTEKRKAQAAQGPSAKEVREIMAADGFLCTTCGIGGAEAYPDDSSETATLGVTRLTIRGDDGSSRTLGVTECKRCRAGGSRSAEVSVPDVMATLRQLDTADEKRLSFWMERGRRGALPIDRAWSAYRRLPREARDEVRARFLGA